MVRSRSADIARRRVRGTGGTVACVAVAVASAGITTRSLAQVPLPGSIEPGRIQERVVPQRPPAPKPELPELKGAAPELPPGVEAIRVTLKDIQVEAATPLPPEPAQAAERETRRYVGREITGRDVFELARALTAIWRNAGYILSQVVVPPQSLAEGGLKLRVVEGYIASVRVEGDPSARDALVELGEKIKASRPLQAGVLERYLLIANELPGVQVRSVLAPSQTAGAADLTLIATVKKGEGYLSLDNYGSKYLGPGQLTAGAAANRLSGDDQLHFLGVGASDSEMAYGELGYSRVLTSEGLKLSATGSATRTKPGDVLAPFDIRGSADIGILSLSYPILRTRNDSLVARAAYDYRNVNTDTLGVRVIEDRIRALRLGANWTALDGLDGSNTFDVELSKGLGGTKAGDPLESRAGADGRFGKAVLDYQRVQYFGASYSLTAGTRGQWTDEPLLSSEQFALGGRLYGRAYDPAELVGDRALAFRMQPAYTGIGDGDWLKSYQAYGFYDVGKVWYVGDVPAGSQPSRSLASAGFGVNLLLDKNATATLEAAWPLTKPVASYEPDHGNDVRIHGSVVLRF